MSDDVRNSKEYQEQMQVMREVMKDFSKTFKKKEGDSEKFSFHIRFDELRDYKKWTLVQLKPDNKRVGDFDTMEELAMALVAFSKGLK